MSELLTLQEAATRLRVSRRTVYRLIKERKIVVTKVRGSAFVTGQEVERYIKAATRRVA